jgi:phosphoglycerate dehydrogenase-like enzyme
MGASVTGIRRHADPLDGEDIHTVDRLHDLLPDTDILLVCLPLTDETRGLIGDEELSLLPSHAVLVNIGRGEIVSEEPLYRHLESGSIGAAGIDVWYSYPGSERDRTDTPPSGYPFGELDNVVMSPHRGGAFGVERLEELRIAHLADTLNAIAEGREPAGRIDLELGY